MRDKANYRAPNGRAPAAVSTVGCLPLEGPELTAVAGCPSAGRRVSPILPREHVHRRAGPAGNRRMGIHSIGIHTYPLEWTAAWIGLVSIAIQSIGYQ